MAFFVNKTVEATYQVRPHQPDCTIIIPTLKWRSKLSRITPRIAAYLISQGTNMFVVRVPSHHPKQK